MKISIAGTGNVGLSSAIFIAQNNEVVVLDIIQAKADIINDRLSPIMDAEFAE